MHPTVCRAYFLADVVAKLVSFDNPKGYVTNFDIDMGGGILHKDCSSYCFDVQ